MKPVGRSAVLVCAAATFFLAAGGCGGGGAEGANTGTTETTPATKPDPEQAKEARLRSQQEATCAPMCERLADCAVEDLRANQTPEEVAAMDLEKLLPRYLEECNGDCNRSSLSPRQIQIVRGCLGKPLQCPDYLNCLDAAKRK